MPTFTVAQAAERTGLTVHTLRYYEREGLMLATVSRTSSGHRAYSERDISWIELLTRLRATGMSIARMKQYRDMVLIGPGNEPNRLELLIAHRDQVREQLRETEEHLAAIESKIAVYTELADNQQNTTS